MLGSESLDFRDNRFSRDLRPSPRLPLPPVRIVKFILKRFNRIRQFIPLRDHVLGLFEGNIKQYAAITVCSADIHIERFKFGVGR